MRKSFFILTTGVFLLMAEEKAVKKAVVVEELKDIENSSILK